MLTDQEIMDKGFQAAQALDYITVLFKAAQNAILDRIIELSAEETFKFSVLKSELLCLEELLSMVQGDINAGTRLLNKLQGDVETGGIL